LKSILKIKQFLAVLAKMSKKLIYPFIFIFIATQIVRDTTNSSPSPCADFVEEADSFTIAERADCKSQKGQQGPKK